MSQEPADADVPPTKFYAVVLDSVGQLTVEEFDTLDKLVDKLKALIDHDVSVFSFSGTQLKLSKPPFRHLLTPWGAKPLFTVQSDQLEEDATGYLGIDPIHFEDPPQIKVPQSRTPSAGADEFFDDNDQTLGVFDNILPDPDS